MIKGHLFKNYLGLPGAGKTLSAIEEEILPAYLSGQKIYSNCWLNLEGINYFNDIEEILTARNAVVFFDEIGQILDPYAWKDLPYSTRRWFQNHRKYHLDIIATTQDVSFVAKPARVLITDWVFCENNSHGPIVEKLLSLFGIREVIIKQQVLTTYELQKLQKGVGASPLVDKDLEEEDNFSEDIDIDFSEIELENKVETKHYSFKKLSHLELNDLKKELFYFYCPVCASRQYYKIPKGQEFKWFNLNKKKEFYCKMNYFCPNHPKQRLDFKVSPIYDTDYIIEVLAKDIIWKPFVPSKAGERLVLYKGAVSMENAPKSARQPNLKL